MGTTGRTSGAGSAPKTRVTGEDPRAFVASVEHPGRRADAEHLLTLFEEVTGAAPELWGPSIVGFGRYSYRYESGREGEWMRTGFSPRARNLVLYVMPGFAEVSDLLEELGRHRVGKSCLYLNRLADVDEDVLRRLVERAWNEMAERHGAP